MGGWGLDKSLKFNKLGGHNKDVLVQKQLKNYRNMGFSIKKHSRS